MSERYRCSVSSRGSDEPLHATASQVHRWLLVEEPSGWGRDAVVQSRLAPEVALALRGVARAARARLLLIRRHGRYQPQQRTCLVAVTAPDIQRVERFRFDHAAELLDLDWSPLRGNSPMGGESVEDPVFLVCTNGRHDPCCAEFGRPVAQALAQVLPEAVWESSHFGGDRFAANVVCLPDGVYYGHVTPLSVTRLARDYAAGTLHLDHYRGRSSFPFAVQAAEHFVRESSGASGIGDVQPIAWQRLAEDRHHVELVTAGGHVMVVVESYPDSEAAQLTCHAETLLHATRFRLVSVEHAA